MVTASTENLSHAVVGVNDRDSIGKKRVFLKEDLVRWIKEH